MGMWRRYSCYSPRVSTQTLKTNRTPLSMAAMYGHEAVVKLLLANGVNTDSGDIDGQMPLLLAAEYGHEAVVKLLLANDVKINSRDIND
jgi:ankyrin repeat protein